MAKEKKTPTKKQLKALEKARRAKARKRKQELRKKRDEYLKPFYSEITGKRYKTEAGMKRAEAKEIAIIELGQNLIPKLILDAEAQLPRGWDSLGYKKNVWPHKKVGACLHTIFYDIQGNWWDDLFEGSIREAYNRTRNIDKKYTDDHTLREFITEIMSIEDTDEMVYDTDESEDITDEGDIFGIEVDFS